MKRQVAEEVYDKSMPKMVGMHKRAGELMKQLNDESKQLQRSISDESDTRKIARNVEVSRTEVASLARSGQLSSLTAAQLSSFLKTVGASRVTGKKADLIAAVTAYFQ